MKNMFTLSKKEYNLIKVAIFIFTILLILPTFFVEKQIVFLVHVVYIPILVGGLIIGKWYGLTLGLLTGVLLGPVLQQFVSNDISQNILDQLSRIFVYSLL